MKSSSCVTLSTSGWILRTPGPLLKSSSRATLSTSGWRLPTTRAPNEFPNNSTNLSNLRIFKCVRVLISYISYATMYINTKQIYMFLPFSFTLSAFLSITIILKVLLLIENLLRLN
jgi:hypothetical protein